MPGTVYNSIFSCIKTKQRKKHHYNISKHCIVDQQFRYKLEMLWPGNAEIAVSQILA